MDGFWEFCIPFMLLYSLVIKAMVLDFWDWITGRTGEEEE